jgi:uroporphyrinogen decarboxylase
MTSYERFMAVLEGGPADRAPVAPAIFGVAARLNGYKLSEYVTSGKVIAETQLKAREQIGHDVLFAFADLSVEAEALGCILDYENDAYPSIRRYVLDDINEIDNIGPPDFSKNGRFPVVLEACSRMREAEGNNCLIAACVMGPLSIASQLIGLEKLLYLTVDNPEGVEHLLDFTEDVALRYGKALMLAGAHCPFIFDPVASPVVIPSSLFLRYEAPRLKRIYDAFRAEGSRVSWISIAGATQRIIPHFSEIGINLATIDYVVPITEAFELESNIAFNGNLKPYSFVSGTAGTIREEVKSCVREARGKGRYIVGSGCEIPVESNSENIRAIVEAVEHA